MVAVVVTMKEPPCQMLGQDFANLVALERAGFLQFWRNRIAVFIHAPLDLFARIHNKSVDIHIQNRERGGD